MAERDVSILLASTLIESSENEVWIRQVCRLYILHSKLTETSTVNTINSPITRSMYWEAVFGTCTVATCWQ